MKINADHYHTLLQAIVRAKESLPGYSVYAGKGLSAKRWRWDLLWHAKHLGYLPDRFIEDGLYPYCNDDHIDTALRRITSTH